MQGAKEILKLVRENKCVNVSIKDNIMGAFFKASIEELVSNTFDPPKKLSAADLMVCHNLCMGWAGWTHVALYEADQWVNNLLLKRALCGVACVFKTFVWQVQQWIEQQNAEESLSDGG